MVIARQSTARTFMVGPVLDADGVAVTDGVVADFEVSKNGGDPAALDGSATLTHRGVGFYSLAATANDLDTVGQAEFLINDTVNACPIKAITVVEEAVYDVLFVASATGAVLLQATQTGVTIPTVTTLTNAPSDSSGVTTLLSRLSSTRAGYLDNLSAGAVALEASLQALITTIGASAAGVATAVWAAGTRTLSAFAFSVTVDTNNDKTGYALSSAGVQAIWDALTSALTAVGSIGKLLVDNINATISSRLASAGYTAPPSAAAVADQVWEETLADHSGTAGSTAAALNAAGSAGDPWNTALPGAYGAGSAGKIIGDNLNAPVDDLPTNAELATALDPLPTNAELSTALAAADDAMLSALASVASAITALNNLSDADVRAQIAAELDTIVPDSIPADNVRPSMRQAAYMGTQFLLERSVSGTTLTVKKVDGTTTLFTLTLGDAVSPTSVTRAT